MPSKVLSFVLDSPYKGIILVIVQSPVEKSSTISNILGCCLSRLLLRILWLGR
jgi:hypothetical protein